MPDLVHFLSLAGVKEIRELQAMEDDDQDANVPTPPFVCPCCLSLILCADQA